MAAGLVGYFGKIPSKGDFVAEHLPSSFIEPWDAWLRLTLAHCRERMGEAAREAFLSSPVWRFVLAGGVCGFAAAMFGPENIAVYLVAVSVVIVACWCLKVSTAARLAAITTTIVLLVPAQGPIWGVALFRFAEVTLGMLCALPVSWLFSYVERRWLHA